MLKLLKIKENSYEVHDEETGFCQAAFEVYVNPFHAGHAYLKTDFQTDDSAKAKEIFALLSRELGRPLQIMTYSTPELYGFLTEGGFARRRCCLEIEVTPANLVPQNVGEISLVELSKGAALYDQACRILYNYYQKTHQAVNPLTADLNSFSRNLPDSVLAQVEKGQILHLAFIEEASEETEIAYVATVDLPSFANFSYSLVEKLFKRTSGIFFECDDTDPAAMLLKACFQVENPRSFDTYIYEV